MALPAILLKAKNVVKKGAQTYNAAQQAKNLKNGEAGMLPISAKYQVLIMSGISVFIIPMIAVLLITVYPFIVAQSAFASGGGGSGGTGTYTGDLAYLQWAIDIANDDSHGYSQCNRTGPDYDCSSLVWYSLYNTGFDKNILGSYPFSTYGEAAILKNLGFKEYTYTGHADLQPGDILLRDGHTGIYVGEDKTVEAHISENGGVCGNAGDQTGKEIDVSVSHGSWSTYYRLGR